MTAPTLDLKTALEEMRERMTQLERETVALRSEIAEISLLVSWKSSRTLTPGMIRDVPVGGADVARYQQQTGSRFSDSAVRLMLQAQKAATRLKHALPPAERGAAVRAVLAVVREIGATDAIDFPIEFEAVIGD